MKEFYPTVGLHSPNESVTFNFGKKKFKFDLKNHILNEKREGIKVILDQAIHSFEIH